MKLSLEQPQLSVCCGEKGSPIGYKYVVSFYHMILVHTCRILTVKVPQNTMRTHIASCIGGPIHWYLVFMGSYFSILKSTLAECLRIYPDRNTSHHMNENCRQFRQVPQALKYTLRM